MLYFQIFAHCNRQSAPTDGRDPFVNAEKKDAFYTSKQNSDAHGLFYQWGRKDPSTFATNSEKWGTEWDNGKYPIKVYTIDGVLIYQESNGSTNKDKQPVGGVIYSSTVATSMKETIKNPIKLYGEWNGVISQVGHTKDLWSYYWTSYSRGTDGNSYPGYNNNWHNDYLEGYISQRSKSIYDPCPFNYRLTSNGSFNSFIKNKGWNINSYIGGELWSLNDFQRTWFLSSGCRYPGVSNFAESGRLGLYYSSIINNLATGYTFTFNSGLGLFQNRTDKALSSSNSVRCIDFFVSPPRPTEEIRLATEVSIQVSKTVTLMECSINGDVKTHLRLQQIVNNGEELVMKEENILLRYIL